MIGLLVKFVIMIKAFNILTDNLSDSPPVLRIVQLMISVAGERILFVKQDPEKRVDHHPILSKNLKCHIHQNLSLLIAFVSLKILHKANLLTIQSYQPLILVSASQK